MLRIVNRRPSALARRTGLAYLGIIGTGLFAEFAVRKRLVVDDDPAATAENIVGSPRLFKVGIGADVVMVALDTAVAVGLFRLLRRDQRRTLASSGLRLVQGGVIAVNLVNLVRALDSARRAVGPDDTVHAEPARDALDAVERHALGYDTGLIAFGLSCLVLGRQLQTANLVARPLAVGMSVTGLVYLAGSSAAHLAPRLSSAIAPLYAIPMVVELAFALRLVARGLDAPARVAVPGIVVSA